ncbi:MULTISPECIES: hypothetical protein [unclassified Streptomyces]|uniref:hypothetical protein n=1 Tax=unclassified Streptomyces TaxID=2593676 RepID=UPI0033B14E44
MTADRFPDPGDPERDLDCAVFVAVPYRDELWERVARAVPGAVRRDRTLHLPSLRADWGRNDHAGDGLPDDDFIGWPSVLVCEPVDDPPAAEVIDAVSRLLTAFWTLEVRAVASCDYERELPADGGARYCRPPWPPAAPPPPPTG